MSKRTVEDKAARGVWAPALTPVDADLSPDRDRYAAHVKGLLDAGCHGVAIFGTTGEATSFSVDERMALLDAVLEAGAPADRLMIGTGLPALTDTVQLTRHAVSVGCRRVLMLPPFYFKGPSDEGLFNSYAQVIDRVGDASLRIFLYHFPRLSGVPITPGLIERLLDAFPETVVGVKDSSGDWDSTRTLIETYPNMAVFPGSESLLLKALETGGVGCITATANVNAPAIRSVFDAWHSGADAGPLQDDISRVRAVFDQWSLVPALKAVIADLRGDEGWQAMRPPLMPLDDAARRRLLDDLAKAEFDAGQTALDQAPLEETGTG